MKKILASPRLGGTIAAVPSKSEAHRALICAALSEDRTVISCGRINADIDATAACLRELGAAVVYADGRFAVTPPAALRDESRLNCGESGSTLRFMLPIAAAVGGVHIFRMCGRLAERPLSPLDGLLTANGTLLTRGNPIVAAGRFRGGELSIDGGVSSQFVSGLLFALTLTGGSLTLTGKVESRHYIEMTVDVLRSFGADIRGDGRTYTVKKEKLRSPGRFSVGGDWSNAAFFLAAGAIGSHAVTVTGLDPMSAQGDRGIVDILRDMGASVSVCADSVTAEPSALHATELDASQVPDLVPAVAVAACAAEGVTRIYNASRLRLKESDRIASVCRMINALGGRATPTDDGMEITGCELCGGTVSSANDHRIAMSAAIAATRCHEPVTVLDAGAVAKSYPDFWDDFGGLML